jgi:outer membrane protein assembly factor BamB
MSETSFHISDYSQYLDKIKGKVQPAIHTGLQKEVIAIIDELKKRSPIDSGIFISSWKHNLIASNPTTVGYRISNDTPYAQVLDEGAEPGGKPWNFPNPNNPGPVSKSGKLIYANGRVWAGGKSPSGFVVGGIVDPIIMYNRKRQIQVAQTIAEHILRLL